jgi:glutathione S-transferase
MSGIRFAFPRMVSALEKGDKYQKLFAFEKKVAEESSLEDYLKSKKRASFSEGLFRYYEELDGES